MESSQTIPKYLRFPKSYKPKRWAAYLGRHLTREEHHILQDLGFEIGMNGTLKQLQTVCVTNGLKIGTLTNLHGNCLFESLIHHKIGNDVESLRVGLASIMHIFRKKKNFFPGQEDTLEDLFVPFNEVGYARGSTPIQVGDKTHWKETIYKYDYNVMLQELSNQYCWDALLTQLILMVVSFLYRVDIVIIHSDTGHKTNINMFQMMENPPELKKIYLGLLGESHYIPVDELYEDDELIPPQYEEALTRFTKWAREKEQEKINYWFLQQHNQKSKNEEEHESFPLKTEEKKEYQEKKQMELPNVKQVESQFVNFSETAGEQFNIDLDLEVTF